jgi:hypothetical protein
VLVVPVSGTDTGARLQALPHWKARQMILWAEARKETGRGKDRFKIRELLAVLDVLSTTDVGTGPGPG